MMNILSNILYKHSNNAITIRPLRVPTRMRLLKSLAMLLLATTVVESVANEVNNCTFLSELENALYNTAYNKRHLNEAFFPPKQLTSRYIVVNYNFTSEDGFYDESDMCNVTYIWSIGGFLFIEPPSIFRFLSLLFSFPANDQTDITLTLPHQCRGLVITKTNDCSCKNKGNIWEQLTQQVNTIFYVSQIKGELSHTCNSMLAILSAVSYCFSLVGKQTIVQQQRFGHHRPTIVVCTYDYVSSSLTWKYYQLKAVDYANDT